MVGPTADDKPNVVKSRKARLCDGPGCPMCSPFGLATYFIGLMAVLYLPWPYSLLGWATVALSFLQARWRIKWE
jgi:hypothetical protein